MRGMNKLPPLIELRAFDAAARHLSFKKAAAELGVTPTAISHQIRLLERYCGRALFRRRPRPLSLTEAGARLFPIIRDGLEAFAIAIATVKRDGDKQPLRVTTTNAFASRWLVPRLPRWRKVRPNAPLDVIGTDSVLDLHAGDADVAIRYARTLPTDCIAKEFLSDSFWPVCNRELLTSGLKSAAERTRSRSLLLVTIRSRGSNLAEVARGCAKQVARCAGIQGHGPPELQGGAACNRGSDRRTGHWHF